MENYDEKILSARKTQRKQDIYQGEVVIGGDVYHFSECSLGQEMVTLMLPDSFIDMPEAAAKVKYPMEQRPSCIKTNLDTSVNFAFNVMSQRVNDSQLPDMISQFRNGLRRMYPLTRFFDARVITLPNQAKLGWFDMKTAGFDEPIYTVMAFTPLKKQLLHLIFNAPARNMTEWKPVVLQVLQSIRVKEDGGKENHERI